jgi:hypothetical protein
MPEQSQAILVYLEAVSAFYPRLPVVQGAMGCKTGLSFPKAPIAARPPPVNQKTGIDLMF